MKFKKIKGSYKKYDFVNIKTIFTKSFVKYIILSITKDMLIVLPIFEEDNSVAVCPQIAMPYSVVSSIKKIDNFKLLFYSYLNNKHIDNAIADHIPKKRNNAKIHLLMQ